MTIILQAENVNKTFSNGKITTPVLHNVSLEVGRGEFVAVMGPSGCGKSTLMHILGLMLTPSSGSVHIEGLNCSKMGETRRAEIRRNKIGFVFQRFNLLPALSVYQNIAIAEQIRRCKPDGQIHRALAAVHMTDRASYKPGELSIGQQQRAAIARAISHRPALLMADEPTGNLDSANARRIMELFREIHQQHGISILMITHSHNAARWADRVIYINDGHITNASSVGTGHVNNTNGDNEAGNNCPRRDNSDSDTDTDNCGVGNGNA